MIDKINFSNFFLSPYYISIINRFSQFIFHLVVVFGLCLCCCCCYCLLVLGRPVERLFTWQSCQCPPFDRSAWSLSQINAPKTHSFFSSCYQLKFSEIHFSFVFSTKYLAQKINRILNRTVAHWNPERLFFSNFI